MSTPTPNPFVAIACGGTGGHLFPGLAVAEELLRRDCDVMLLISPKEVDQNAVKAVRGMQIETLPAVGLTGKNILKFARGFWNSYKTAKKLFQKRTPQIVLAMGGFTSAPPILAGKKAGAKTFIHESNTIPGRANRWLSRFVDGGFVYFPETQKRLRVANCEVTGMPVRPQFLDSVDAASARMALGLNPKNPVLLIMGGSQGASGVNNVVTSSLPILLKALPELQFVHLTGSNDFEKVQQIYAAHKAKAVVRPFFTEMELALGAATVAVSRSGASSLAEIAALRVPSVLIPYPTAADNHQYHNAKAFADDNAAWMLVQADTRPEQFAAAISSLLQNESERLSMRQALEKWHQREAAGKIADQMLHAIGVQRFVPVAAEEFELPRFKAPIAPPVGGKNIFTQFSPLHGKSKGANV